MMVKWQANAEVCFYIKHTSYTQQSVIAKFNSHLKATLKDQKRGELTEISVFEVNDTLSVSLKMLVKTRGDQESDAVQFITKILFSCIEDLTCTGFKLKVEPYFASRYENDPRRAAREMIWSANVSGDFFHTPSVPSDDGVEQFLREVEHIGRIRLSELSQRRIEGTYVFTFSAQVEAVCAARGEADKVCEMICDNFLRQNSGFCNVKVTNAEPLLPYNKYDFPSDTEFEIDMKLVAIRILSESFSFSTAEAIWSKIGNELIELSPKTLPINQKALRVLIGRCLCEAIGLKTNGKGVKA